MAHPWEVDVCCPLCGAKTRLNRLPRHASRQHPEITPKAFEALVVKAAKSGHLKYDTRRVTKPGSMTTATTVLRSGKFGLGQKSTVSGGAFGSGKKA